MATTIKDLDVRLTVEELAWIIQNLPATDGTTIKLRRKLRDHIDTELGL